MPHAPVPAYKQVIPRRVLIVIAALLVMATLVGSFLPGPAKIRLGTEPYEPAVHRVGMAHRVYHLASFGSIAMALLLLAAGTREETTYALAVLGLGCLIETTQHLTGMSEVFEWWDVLDDFYAVAAVFAVVQIANRLAPLRKD